MGELTTWVSDLLFEICTGRLFVVVACTKLIVQCLLSDRRRYCSHYRILWNHSTLNPNNLLGLFLTTALHSCTWPATSYATKLAIKIRLLPSNTIRNNGDLHRKRAAILLYGISRLHPAIQLLLRFLQYFSSISYFTKDPTRIRVPKFN